MNIEKQITLTIFAYHGFLIHSVPNPVWGV